MAGGFRRSKMKRRLWHSKWFILAMVIALFWMATSVKVAYAGTDVQLEKILKAGADGLIAYFAWLIDVLKEIW